MKCAVYLAIAASALSCASGPVKTAAGDVGYISLPELTLVGTDGVAHSLRQEAALAPATIFEFFSADCPVQAAHDARLVELARASVSHGVRVFAVDAEQGSSLERDVAEARARSYPFPILLDPEGALAKAVDARYATFSVAVDQRARVRYRGGIDPDRQRLHDDAPRFLARAIDRLIAGEEPDPAETACLGCYLRRW